MGGYDATGGRSIREEKQEHQRYPKSDWQYEVTNDNTILGYWEWVEHRIDAEEDEDNGENYPDGPWAEGWEERTGEHKNVTDVVDEEKQTLSYYWTCCGGVPLTNEEKCPVCQEKYED